MCQPATDLLDEIQNQKSLKFGMILFHVNQSALNTAATMKPHC